MRKVFLGIVLSGIAAVAMATPAMAAKDPTMGLKAGTAVKFQVVVNEVRIVPDGSPMPGIHFDAVVKGQKLDVYISPVTFATRYGIEVAKGAEVRIEGTQIEGLVLAKNITTGYIDKHTAKWVPAVTIELRNDEGPFWVDAKPTL